MKLKKAYCLKFSINFFGNEIPAGTIYRGQKSNKDWFTPTIVRDKTPMICPNYQLHFTVLNCSDFVEIYI